MPRHRRAEVDAAIRNCERGSFIVNWNVVLCRFPRAANSLSRSRDSPANCPIRALAWSPAGNCNLSLYPSLCAAPRLKLRPDQSFVTSIHFAEWPNAKLRVNVDPARTFSFDLSLIANQRNGFITDSHADFSAIRDAFYVSARQKTRCMTALRLKFVIAIAITKSVN